MTGIDLVAMLTLAVVAAYVYLLGRGERGEGFSRGWPEQGAEIPSGLPADEGALVPDEDRQGTGEGRRAA